MSTIIYDADHRKPTPMPAVTQPNGSTVYARDDASGKVKETKK